MKQHLHTKLVANQDERQLVVAKESKINARINKNIMTAVSILHITTRPGFVPTKTSHMVMIFIS